MSRTISISEIRDKCVNSKMRMGLGPYSPNKDIAYEISILEFEFIVDNLKDNDEFLNDTEVISNLNDIYNYIRNSSFLDNYMYIHIDPYNTNDYSGFIDGSIKEIIRLNFSLTAHFDKLISVSFEKPKDKCLFFDMLEKRIKRVKFLYEHVVNSENKKKDNLRYGMFDMTIEGHLGTMSGHRRFISMHLGEYI